MSKAVFTFQYGDENMKKIEALGYEVVYVPEGKIEDPTPLLDAEVLVCFNPFNQLDLTKMGNLKWIQLVSKGIGHVPQDIVKTQDIRVTYNARATSIPIAEWIVSYILQIFKKAKTFYRQQDKKEWKAHQDILEVYGKTIGFLGTGRIAREAAKRLKAFDAKILGVNTRKAAEEHFDEIYGMDDLAAFYSRCDVVVSTLPGTDKTFHMLDAKAFSQMKDGVTLVNISRGSVINTEDLIVALKAGKFRGVALDVFEQEPLPAESPLWEMEDVIITPHTVLWSDLYDGRVFDAVYNNLKNFKENKELNDMADFVKGY